MRVDGLHEVSGRILYDIYGSKGATATADLKIPLLDFGGCASVKVHREGHNGPFTAPSGLFDSTSNSILRNKLQPEVAQSL